MYVENRPMNCRTCGAGPFWGRTSTQKDRFTGDIITECSWSCGQCGSHIANGIISREPDPNKKQENGK